MLRTLPKTLNETYDRILMSIDEFYIEDTRRMLQWLAFSARPVSGLAFSRRVILISTAIDANERDERCSCV
jgi:hypothetical protein